VDEVAEEEFGTQVTHPSDNEEVNRNNLKLIGQRTTDSMFFSGANEDCDVMSNEDEDLTTQRVRRLKDYMKLFKIES
jgi:hypothetical protein